MKIYPRGLEDLLLQKSKQAIIKYPVSFLKIILRYQIANQISEGGHKLTREEIAVFMMMKGAEQVENLTAEIRDKFTEEQKAQMNLTVIQKLKSFTKSKKQN